MNPRYRQPLEPLTITPNSPQQALWLNIGATPLPKGPQQFLCIKGKGSGYSFASGVVALRWLLAKPGTLVLLIRRTRASIRESTMRTWLKDVIPPRLVRKYSKTTGGLELINGSRIHTIGTQNNPEDLKSIECSLVVIDEVSQIDRSDIDVIIARIRERHPCGNALLMISNPVPEQHWLFRKAQEPGITLIQDVTASNPHLGPDYEETLRRIYGDRADDYLGADWLVSRTIKLSSYHKVHPDYINQVLSHIPEHHFYGLDIGGGGKTGTSRCAIIRLAKYAPLDPRTTHRGTWVVEDSMLMGTTVHSEILGAILDMHRRHSKDPGVTQVGIQVASDPANAYFNREARYMGYQMLDVKKYPGSVESGEILLNTLLSREELIILDDTVPGSPKDLNKGLLEAVGNYDGNEIENYKDYIDALRYGVTATLHLSRGIVM